MPYNIMCQYIFAKYFLKKNLRSVLLSFHLPKISAVCGKLAASSKIMVSAADEIHRRSAACVKMSVKVFTVGVDRHKHSLVVGLSLNNALLIRQQNRAEAAVIERL